MANRTINQKVTVPSESTQQGCDHSRETPGDAQVPTSWKTVSNATVKETADSILPKYKSGLDYLKDR